VCRREEGATHKDDGPLGVFRAHIVQGPEDLHVFSRVLWWRRSRRVLKSLEGPLIIAEAPELLAHDLHAAGSEGGRGHDDEPVGHLYELVIALDEHRG
jgi:hypothetical protein